MNARRCAIVTLGVAAFAALAATCCPASAQVPDRALIAFTLSADGRSEIFLMRSDGSERRRLVAGSEPAWSPDGTRIAFVRPNEDDSERAIVVLDVASGLTRALTSGSVDTSPAWSADGTRIAFSRGGANGGGSIFVVSADAGATTRLTANSRTRVDLYPAWSPDGSAIAFTRITFRSGRVEEEVFVMSPNGAGAHRLVADGGLPAWSPDGARIAFVSRRDGFGERCFEECIPNGELYTMSASGNDQRRLTHTRGNEGNPAWSPDGLRIAFDSDRNSPEGSDGGGTELYSIGADGSCMTWLSNGGAESADPAWEPASRLATDPGPVCGASPRAPTLDIDVSSLRSFKRYPLYWLGPSFGDAILSGLVGTGPLYTDCGSYRARDCPLRIQVQNSSICDRHPFSYGAGGGGGETDDPLDGDTLPSQRFAYRGVIAAAYDSALGWDIYTGATTVSVFGVSASPKAIRPVIRALRPVDDAGSQRLPPPVFSAAFWRKLERFERAYRRYGNATAAGRELGVTAKAVRDKVALAGFLRKHGIRRRSACG